MRRWAIINTLLALIIALVGIEIVRTWARDLPNGVRGEKSAAPGVPATAPEPHGKGKRDRSDDGSALRQQVPALLVTSIIERDVFDPSRRPPSLEETTTTSPPITRPPDNMIMVGVSIVGRAREAFLNDGTQGPGVTRRLRVGDQIAGYSVVRIDQTALTLTSPTGGAVVSMPLTVDKGKVRPGDPRLLTPPRPPQPAGAQMASPAAGVQVPSRHGRRSISPDATKGAWAVGTEPRVP